MYNQCFRPCMNKTDNGFCKTTTCINPLYCNIGTAQYGQGVQKRIITNADKIRTMGDVELVEFFMQEYDGEDSFTCPVSHPCPPEKEASCRECFLDWLKQEANDEA